MPPALLLYDIYSRFLLFLRLLISRRKGLTTPPAACLWDKARVAVDRQSLPTSTRRAIFVIIGRTKKKKRFIFYGSDFFFKSWPSHVPTHVAAPTVARPTLNDFQPHPHEKVSFVCACTEPAGNGIGTVCVERGGQTWPENAESHPR